MSLLRVLGLFALAGGCTLAGLADGGTPKSAAKETRPWLIVEDYYNGAENTGNSRAMRNGQNQTERFRDFSRLLLMQMAKAGRFRCKDRGSFRTQMTENALAKNPEEIQFIKAGRCITWVPRMTRERYPVPEGNRTRMAESDVLTMSIGYTSLELNGNGEVMDSEDVVVRERDLGGTDLLTAVAKEAAKAILFRLAAPKVIAVMPQDGKTLVIVDYGKDFLSRDDYVSIGERQELQGRFFGIPKGSGRVISADRDSATLVLLGGEVKKGYYIRLKSKQEVAEAKAAEAAAAARRQTATEAPSGPPTPTSSTPTPAPAPAPTAQTSPATPPATVQPQPAVAVQQPRAYACTVCRRTGRYAVEERCRECNGTGTYVAIIEGIVGGLLGQGRNGNIQQRCRHCNGHGRVRTEYTCQACSGQGVIYR